MGRMGHVGGKRVSKRHSTVIESAEQIVRFLQKVPEVSNIVLGKIDVHLPPTEWRIKVSDLNSGLRLQVRGTNSIQQLIVYTTDNEHVKNILQQEFRGKYKFIL